MIFFLLYGRLGSITSIVHTHIAVAIITAVGWA